MFAIPHRTVNSTANLRSPDPSCRHVWSFRSCRILLRYICHSRRTYRTQLTFLQAASQLQRHPRQRLALLPEACHGRETPPRATRPEVTTSTNTTQVETQRTLPRTLPALCTASLCQMSTCQRYGSRCFVISL